MECPKCNFSVPGNAEVLEGQDGARSKFRKHVDRMRAGNRQDEPFGEYVAAARGNTTGKPTPSDVWDAYVQSTDAEDALPINPATERNTESETGDSTPEPAPDVEQGTEVTSGHA